MASSETTPAAPPRRRIGIVVVPLVIFATIAIIFGIALQSGDPSKLPSALIGKPAPTVNLPPVPELADDRGRPVPGFSTANLGGGPAVINFWASWCVPCIQEHPLLVEIARRSGVPIHGINYKDQAVAARRFLGPLRQPLQHGRHRPQRPRGDRVGRLRHARDVRRRWAGADRLQARWAHHGRIPRRACRAGDRAGPRRRPVRRPPRVRVSPPRSPCGGPR